MEIKILGPGCPKCEQTGKIVAEAVSETGVEATVEKVVIDGDVKCVGKIPKKEDVTSWLTK